VLVIQKVRRRASILLLDCRLAQKDTVVLGMKDSYC
jgi:hypothetical protein